MSLLNGNFLLEVLTSVGEKHKTMDKQQAAFSLCLPLTICTLCMRECVCVCVCERVSFSRKASKYMRSALGLCLALARLGQTHSKFPEGEHREKRFHADKSLAQIKRQISGKDKRC